MRDEHPKLRLPRAVAFTVTVGIATALGVAAASCGDDDGEHVFYYCEPLFPFADAGGGGADTGSCGGTVDEPTECPAGCRAVREVV